MNKNGRSACKPLPPSCKQNKSKAINCKRLNTKNENTRSEFDLHKNARVTIYYCNSRESSFKYHWLKTGIPLFTDQLACEHQISHDIDFY
jgi:hypothetical protein